MTDLQILDTYGYTMCPARSEFPTVDTSVGGVTCQLSSDQSLLENSAGETSCVSVFFLVSASRHRRRASSVIRASTELRLELGWRQIVQA